MFERQMLATWADMDFNSHMRNTAFLDKAADLRFMYFASCGLTIQEFMRLAVGPVVQKDEVEYFKEFRLLEAMRVTIAAAGLSDDGARFAIRNEFFRDDGRLAARVTSTGGWLDLRARKLVVPPPVIRDALQRLSRIDSFQVLKPLQQDGERADT
jgi:acyl-CoA thioester hydrolase